MMGQLIALELEVFSTARAKNAARPPPRLHVDSEGDGLSHQHVKRRDLRISSYLPNHVIGLSGEFAGAPLDLSVPPSARKCTCKF